MVALDTIAPVLAQIHGAQCMGLHASRLSLSGLQVEKPEDILSAEKLIFPGVGSFGQAMRILTKKGLVKPLKEYVHVSATSRCATAAPYSGNT